MMFYEEVVQGAAAARRASKKNSMEVWVRLETENPDWEFDRLFDQWMEIVSDDKDLLKDALLQTAVNFASRRKNQLRSKPRSPRSPNEVTAAVEAIKTKIRAVIIADHLCPNGKTTSENSGAYLIKCGGGYSRIGKAIKPNQIAGTVLTKRQMQDLWEGK